MAGKTKRSIDDIKKLFEERNYKLLSNEYINNVQKLKYICPKHNDVVQSISLNNFLRGAGCKYCGRERSAEKHKKYNIDIIKKLFLKKDYVLLSTEYKDIYSPLEYICNKHKNITQKILLSNFLSGNGCPDCAKERQRHNYRFIKEEFNKRDYTLITQEYVHAHQYLKYICNKHKYLGIQKIKYNKLQQDRGCRACALSKGEKKIAKYLIKNNYYFIQEFVFNVTFTRSLPPL